MPYKIELHPEAVAEASAARFWYAERSADVATAFADALDHAMAMIADLPKTWAPHTHGTRRYLIAKFPYAVVYRVRGKAVEVVAIAHQRRRPGYWSER